MPHDRLARQLPVPVDLQRYPAGQESVSMKQNSGSRSGECVYDA